MYLFLFVRFNQTSSGSKTEYSLKFVSGDEVILEKTVSQDYTLTSSDFPVNPTKDGYTFNGWFVDSLKITVGYVITQDTIANARFSENTNVNLKQDGSKEYPYLISTANDLVNFADRINHMDEEIENPEYYKSYFKLVDDIDMQGVNFTPIGKEIQIIDEDEEYTIYGFMGNFNGNGHTIKNLEVNIDMKTNKTYYGGLFALTNHAYIFDLSLENIKYSVESGSDVATRSIVIGGVVGLAKLSTFENITITGVIETSIFESNQAYIGGIAGQWNVSDGGNAYFAFARNCYTNVETKIGEIESEQCSLESACNGGLFGSIYNYNSTVAIINSSTTGVVYGGKYVGGLIGNSSSDNVSILDSCSSATVYATASEVTYTGGLVGMTQGDTIIKDCFYNGPVVRGTRANSNTYLSYAGGIVGYAAEDDYQIYYVAGIACVNSYYNTIIRGANNTSKIGISFDGDFTLDYVKKELQWDLEAWQLVEGKFIPTNKPIKDQTFNVNLIIGENIVNTIEISTDEGTYDILGNIPDGDNFASQIFYNWQVQEGNEYRFYMPVIKDMNIYGKYYDVSEITGVYIGTGTLYETIDAGIIVLADDGTLQWINSSTIGGKYKYDGEHIIFEIYNSTGVVSGTIKNGVFDFLVDAGMSGEVAYNFVKSELSFFGEYFSENGDILTFSGENSISFQSTALQDGSYVNGTYTQEGNILTINGNNLESTYSSMTIVDNGDMTLTANFISKDPNIPSLENVKFSKILNKDYSNYNFIGSYNLSYVSVSSSTLQSEYVITLNADGTATYQSTYSSTPCEYYAFNDGKTIKLILEGYASEFTYDIEGNFFYGKLNRGSSSAQRSIIMAPAEEGMIYALVIDGVNNVLFVNEKRKFLVQDGTYQFNAEVSVESIKNGSHVKINDQEYILFVSTSEYTTSIGYYLSKIGAEVGIYTYAEKTLNLDGIGNVTGDINGFYVCYDNNLVVIVTNEDSFIGFDFIAAKNNNNKITKIDPHTIQGVWYSDVSVSGEQNEKYYKLLLDGYGHSAFMYKKVNSKTNEITYQYNWGYESSWVGVVATDTNIYCDYNKYQHCVMQFYYDNNLMYSTEFGYIGTIAMYKEGYTGEMVPPTLPSTVIGSYIGETIDKNSVVLNIRQDLAGTYSGYPFTATYDGGETVIFVINNVVYNFNIKTFVLSYNEVKIQLTFNGAINEVIPEVLCGIWIGTNWEGMGANETSTITIEKDGTVKYVEQTFSNVTFDYETMTIYGTGKSSAQEDVSITIIYDENTKTIDVKYEFIYDGENYLITGSNLTKKDI